MAVVPAHVGVGDDACLEIVRVSPREIQRRGKGVGDVAGVADPLADDDRIGLERPLPGSALRKPIAAMLEDRLAQPVARERRTEDSDESVSGLDHFRGAMSELHLLAHGFPRRLQP
jgi:hypothetical protein